MGVGEGARLCRTERTFQGSVLLFLFAKFAQLPCKGQLPPISFVFYSINKKNRTNIDCITSLFFFFFFGICKSTLKYLFTIILHVK